MSLMNSKYLYVHRITHFTYVLLTRMTHLIFIASLFSLIEKIKALIEKIKTSEFVIEEIRSLDLEGCHKALSKTVFKLLTSSIHLLYAGD